MLTAGVATDASENEAWKKRRQDAFNELAMAQRGEPEEAMHALQHEQIAQLYGWVCEHVGDLTHRMAQRFEWFHGNGPICRDKIGKTLKSLTQSYGFKREMNEQIVNNARYKKKNGVDGHTSAEEARKALKRLGQAYADTHRQLVVYNELQWTCREAAIAVGEQDFDKARQLLRQLYGVFDVRGVTEDEEMFPVWARQAGEFTGKPFRLDQVKAR